MGLQPKRRYDSRMSRLVFKIAQANATRHSRGRAEQPDKKPKDAKMKFALAISAKKITINKTRTQIKAAYTSRAISETEAIGIGIELAEEEWPSEAGWEDHSCVTCEVPK